MFYIVLALTAVFMLDISNIYVANILFVLEVILLKAHSKKAIVFYKNHIQIFLLYLFWCFFSTYVFFEKYQYFELRNIIQLTYNLQYIILITGGLLNKQKIKQSLYNCSIILALTIILLWILKLGMNNILVVIQDREWGEKYLSGWPNSLPLPLLFGFYSEMKSIFRKKNEIIKYIRIFIFIFAILLCTSRTGYVGVILITFYFLLNRRKSRTNWNKIVKNLILILICIFCIGFIINFIILNDLAGRMFMVSDRLDIYRDALNYTSARPFIGFGGNSIDVIYQVFGRTVSGINWGHTHNTFFELLIRYGIIGTFLFLFFIFRVSKLINSKDDKAMFWILWTLSLFQIYYRDFVFLLLLYMLIPSKRISVINEIRKC